MAQRKLTKTIKIFLASPGDLKVERKIAREVVSVVNESIGRKQKIKFELLGWEDLPATRGRPQSVINQRLLNQADLFVGILWRTWGTPTGEHSSGFEEEFKMAERQSNIKYISLFFKTNSNGSSVVKSRDFNRINKFKKMIRSKRGHLYTEFKGNTWKDTFYNYILNQIAIYLTDNKIYEDSAIGRVKKVMSMLEINTSELALQIGEKSPEYLMSVLNGASADFNFLDRICERFHIDKGWLKTGLGYPLKRIEMHEFDLQETEKFLGKSYDELTFYFFMDKESEVKSVGCAIKEDDYKYIVYRHHIHLSSHVGGTGSWQIHDFHLFIKKLYKNAHFYAVNVSKKEFWDLVGGSMSFKKIDKMGRDYDDWALDFVDIDYKIFPRETHIKNHGEEYAKALDIAKEVSIRQAKPSIPWKPE